MGKLTKISICNEKIYFKHQFIVVNDLNTDIILGIPFLTQIYPFWIDSNGLGTKIMGQSILFNFIIPVRCKEVKTLQTNSIYHNINLIQRKDSFITQPMHSSSSCIHASDIGYKILSDIEYLKGSSNSLPDFLNLDNRFKMNADKGKSPIQKTVNSKDYEIQVSSLSSSPIQNSNRFQVLGNFPPLPYAMTSPTPSSKIQSTSRPQSTSDSSPYFTKKYQEHLLLTTFNEVPDYKTLTSFVNKILPLGCQWIPDDPLKNQRYYELVLVDSGSIELYHTMDKNNPDKISYSKCIIKRIIKPTEWASLATMKDFTVNFIPKGYSYHDYRMS